MNCLLKTLNRTKKDVIPYEHKINIHTPVSIYIQPEGEGGYNVRIIYEWITYTRKRCNLHYWHSQINHFQM